MKEMTVLKLHELLRYLITGVVVTTISYLCEPEAVSTYLKTIGSLGVPIAIFAAGVLCYLVYHALLYRFFFITLKDLIKPDNIRKFIKDKAGLDSPWDAENLYYLIRDSSFSDDQKDTIYTSGAGIHFLNISTIMFAFGAIWSGLSGMWVRTFAFALGSVVIYLAGLLSDLTLEKKEFTFLCMQIKNDNKNEIEKLIQNFNIKKKS